MIENLADDFATTGALHFKGVIRDRLAELEAALVGLPAGEAGIRIHGIDALEWLLSVQGPIGCLAASVLGPAARPVRAILFDKSPQANWSLPWHQDRTICVKDKREAPGFGPWTTKRGMHHVEPPFDILQRMVTLRAHLDDVPATNAPLLTAPGSHTLGRIAASEANEVAGRCDTLTCLAVAGDVWLYATPILHASAATSKPTSRRVLQVDYSADDLPHGLEWLGV